MADFYKWYVDDKKQFVDEEGVKSVFFVTKDAHPLWHDLFGVDVWINNENGEILEIFVTHNFTNPKEWEEELPEASPELIKSIWKGASKQLQSVFITIFNNAR